MPWVISAVAVVASVGLVGAAALSGTDLVAPKPAASADVTLDAAETSEPPAADPAEGPAGEGVEVESPAVEGPAVDTAAYDVAGLSLLDVWEVMPELAVDDDPHAPLTGYTAQPLDAGAPVFVAPGEEPIAFLPRDHVYGGTIVPVVEQYEHWLKVLLPGRQGVPPEGNAAQVVGWLRTADVEQRRNDSYVEVQLTARTVDIVTATGVERVADDFAWGKTATPTPVGRTFIMLTKVEPAFAYTEGHPLVYLGVQSPTLAGFDGGEVAVTAFHYYKHRSGPNSFGCIYLDGPSVDRLALLPAGTPVIIRP